MQVRTIRCEVCGAVIGTLTKPEITEADVETYRQMVTCPNGHDGSVSLVEHSE